MIAAVRRTQRVTQNSANGSPSTNGSVRLAKKIPTRMPTNGSAESACVSSHANTSRARVATWTWSRVPVASARSSIRKRG